MFDLKRPCTECPFLRTCRAGWLGEARAEQIAGSILKRQQSFLCHKTMEVGGADGKNEQHCAGASIMLEKMERPNQMMRVCERLGGYDRAKLDMTADVFDDESEFIDHHSS